MSKRIAVLGAGAIGSSVSADLTKAGLDVTVIDQWPAQVEAMKSAGLRIRMTDEDLQIPVRALHLCEVELSGEIFTPGLVQRIPTPVNDAVVGIDRQINAGEIRMDLSNLDLLKTMVGARG